LGRLVAQMDGNDGTMLLKAMKAMKVIKGNK
jgi:hypothetical protein